MKKFIKFILVLGLLLLPCFSSADDVEDLITKVCSDWNSSCDYSFITTTNWIYQAVFSNWVPWKTYCIKLYDYTPWDYQMKLTFASSITQNPYTVFPYWQDWNNSYICIKGNTYLLLQNPWPSTSIKWDMFELDNLLASSLPVMTSLECQTEYSLIPISEITTNYCKLNFDLISPFECPSGGGCSWSGESIVFSNVYVNNVLYPGGADIYLNVNELLATEISYNSQLMYIDVDYDWDQDYINGIIDINTYQPTSNDFTQIFVGGLVRLFPYIVIALFIAFVRKLIRKIFK